MSREVSVKGTDWDKANCRGMNTEIFYLEERDLKYKDLDNETVRKICFTCPIQKDCLQAGLDEEFGIWGGFTRRERTKIRNQRINDPEMKLVRSHLKELNITLEQAIKGVA